ncbi:hypothetical protein HNP93_001355 [Methanococcus maripaludis]|uniref:Uncharacterized protein n=1 Tax=Methanococcus maripaludis TaxID=39152 RepID=A0A7J9P781_METMI|nr:hypothetical protein [Methanococcus maripaludis]MBA2858654.1 hypothetical protein [Methanococcus maripaludis]
MGKFRELFQKSKNSTLKNDELKSNLNQIGFVLNAIKHPVAEIVDGVLELADIPPLGKIIVTSWDIYDDLTTDNQKADQLDRILEYIKNQNETDPEIKEFFNEAKTDHAKILAGIGRIEKQMAVNHKEIIEKTDYHTEMLEKILKEAQKSGIVYQDRIDEIIKKHPGVLQREQIIKTLVKNLDVDLKVDLSEEHRAYSPNLADHIEKIWKNGDMLTLDEKEIKSLSFSEEALNELFSNEKIQKLIISPQYLQNEIIVRLEVIDPYCSLDNILLKAKRINDEFLELYSENLPLNIILKVPTPPNTSKEGFVTFNYNFNGKSLSEIMPTVNFLDNMLKNNNLFVIDTKTNKKLSDIPVSPEYIPVDELKTKLTFIRNLYLIENKLNRTFVLPKEGFNEQDVLNSEILMEVINKNTSDLSLNSITTDYKGAKNIYRTYKDNGELTPDFYIKGYIRIILFNEKFNIGLMQQIENCKIKNKKQLKKEINKKSEHILIEFEPVDEKSNYRVVSAEIIDKNDKIIN